MAVMAPVATMPTAVPVTVMPAAMPVTMVMVVPAHFFRLDAIDFVLRDDSRLAQARPPVCPTPAAQVRPAQLQQAQRLLPQIPSQSLESPDVP
jgi:hypothetical protein